MGTCWSVPAAQPPIATYPMKPCISCGSLAQKAPGYEYCDPCLQKSAMQYVAPSAPPMYQTPQYTYAVPYQQQQMYAYYHTPQQQQGISTGAAVLGGFMLGAVMEDILDPTE